MSDTQRDEMQDRLVDLALREAVGGQTPPDLVDRILQAHAADNAQATPVQQTSGARRIRWAPLALAASVLLSVGVLTWPMQQSLQQGRQAKNNVSGNSQKLGKVTTSADASSANRSKDAPSTNAEPLTEHTAGVVADAREAPQEFEALDISQLAPDGALVDQDYDHFYFAHEGTRTAIPGQTKPADGPSAGTPITGPVEAPPASPAPWREWGYDRVAGGRRYYRQDAAPAGNPLGWRRNAGVAGQIEVDERNFDLPRPEGQGPGLSGDRYDRIHENPFVEAKGMQAVSTFSIDVDTASYANVRQFLTSGRLPPADAVRLEELINYFDYGYEPPTRNSGEEPFTTDVEVAGCPWAPAHRVVRIGVKGREAPLAERPLTNLVFLIDVSGSMQDANKLPLVREGMKALVRQLGENDRVSIVVYASSEGVVLPSTPGDEQQKILSALDGLTAGGSTAGGAGIQLAYQLAEDNKITGGVNRVILCTDGDFNVGTTSTGELERLVQQKAQQTGVFLSVCGFGRGNLNDAMMETISNRGNGVYYYIDGPAEAKRVFVKGLTGTLVTIAKDVKIQVEFNPSRVSGYRLLGYENRMLKAQDFNDDKRDAGEIGAGHTVTALYEIVPAGSPVPSPNIDDLKYQQPPAADAAAYTGELLTLKMRYKLPDQDASTKREWPVVDDGRTFAAASADLQWATGVAGFGMLLRGSDHAGNLTWDAVREIAQGAAGAGDTGQRQQFLELVERAQRLSGDGRQGH